MRDDSGQVLALALAAFAVGVLLVTPFLRSVSVHGMAARTYRSSILELCSSGAGVEDAIWGLTNGTLADDLTYAGDTSSYTVAESVNGITPTVSVTRDKVIIASDDFESGDWAGGSGWLAAWTQSGDAGVVTPSSPYEGSYHLRLKGDTGYAKRPVDLSDQPSASLQFQAKARSFESGEEAYCKISPNGSDWTTVKTWVNGDDDDTYHYYDIDLSPYTLSSSFWIAFEASMSGADDYLYVDDIRIVRELPGAGGAAELASDDFESGDWAGGTGWTDNWSYGGRAVVKAGDSPHGGSYHLRLKGGEQGGSLAYARRASDLSGQSGLHLQLWAKVKGLEAGDEVSCQVSPDGAAWTTVQTWTDADDDNTYHYFDIDLSAQAPYSSEFWVAFNSAMNQNNDMVFVDDLTLGGQSAAIAYEIVSVAGSERIRADIVVTGGSVAIEAWQMGRQ